MPTKTTTTDFNAPDWNRTQKLATAELQAAHDWIRSNPDITTRLVIPNGVTHMVDRRYDPGWLSAIRNHGPLKNFVVGGLSRSSRDYPTVKMLPKKIGERYHCIWRMGDKRNRGLENGIWEYFRTDMAGVGTKPGEKSEQGHALDLWNGKDLTFRGMEFAWTRDDALRLGQCHNVDILDSYFGGSNRSGLGLQRDVVNLNVRNCYFAGDQISDQSIDGEPTDDNNRIPKNHYFYRCMIQTLKRTAIAITLTGLSTKHPAEDFVLEDMWIGGIVWMLRTKRVTLRNCIIDTRGIPLKGTRGQCIHFKLSNQDILLENCTLISDDIAFDYAPDDRFGGRYTTNVTMKNVKIIAPNTNPGSPVNVPGLALDHLTKNGTASGASLDVKTLPTPPSWAYVPVVGTIPIVGGSRPEDEEERVEIREPDEREPEEREKEEEPRHEGEEGREPPAEEEREKEKEPEREEKEPEKGEREPPRPEREEKELEPRKPNPKAERADRVNAWFNGLRPEEQLYVYRVIAVATKADPLDLV